MLRELHTHKVISEHVREEILQGRTIANTNGEAKNSCFPR